MRRLGVLTTGDVRRLLGVSYSLAIRWVDSGLLPGFKVPGSRHRRVLVCEFVKFCQRHDLPIPQELHDGREGVQGLPEDPHVHKL